MPNINLGAIADTIALADSAILRGDYSLAQQISFQAFSEAESRLEGTFERALAQALTLHRIGLLQRLSGLSWEEESASAVFRKVDEYLEDAERATNDEELLAIVRRAREASDEQRQVVNGRTGRLPRSCYAVCEHGCRVVILPCGQLNPHC